MFAGKIGYTTFPKRVYDKIVSCKCYVRVNPDSPKIDIIDIGTNSLIISIVMEENIEQRCELIQTKNSVIDKQAEINCNLHVDSQTLTPIKIRQKTNTVKEKVPLKDLPSSTKQVIIPHPFFTLSNVSDMQIMKTKIKRTLEYIDNLKNDEEKKGCIRELTNFVIREYKNTSDQKLKVQVEQLQASRRQTNETKQNMYNLLKNL